MRSRVDDPHEAWGVLNPGGARGPDGTLHLFPRLIAEGNYSRIGHARVIFEHDKPGGVERLDLALEPHDIFEVSAGGGDLEDPRVVYVPLIERYVMTYAAFVPYEPKSPSRCRAISTCGTAGRLAVCRSAGCPSG
jgi:predicted GH43/DUF377 family glycosyl hydrolase